LVAWSLAGHNNIAAIRCQEVVALRRRTHFPALPSDCLDEFIDKLIGHVCIVAKQMEPVKPLNKEDRLAELAAEIADLEKRRAPLAAERDLTIIDESDAGAKRRDVAARAGVTAGRVQQLVDQARRDPELRKRLQKIAES